MSGTACTIESLQADPAANWFGQRLCGLLVPDASSLVSPVAWSLHQWMQGHTCLDLSGSVTARSGEKGAFDMLEARVPAPWLARLQEHPAVVRAAEGSMEAIESPLVLEGSKLFLGRWRQLEISVASALLGRGAQAASWCADPEASRRIEAFVASRGPGLHEDQSRAVRLGATRRLAVVTGGPGTGKTFVAARVIEAVLETGPQPVLLLAPTGKAAARLQASVLQAAAKGAVTDRAAECIRSLKAGTVHSATLRRGGEDLRAARLIVVDETSMIDLERMHELLRLAHPQASVLLLGDPHQLASVEAGSVLSDIVHGSDHPGHPLATCVVALRKSHRFAEHGGVARLAAAVNAGRADEVVALLGEGPEGIRWIRASTPRQVVEESVRALADSPKGTRVLCGHRHGADGSVRVNTAVERQRGISASRTLYAGRPILVTLNDDVTGLRNGDTGELAWEAGSWVARFDGGMPAVPAAKLPAHETAYAMTIHKTQGSEYERVIVALPARPSPVLTRELLYTGFTRTRGDLVVIASDATLRAAIGKPIRRSSGLRERLRTGRPTPAGPA